MNPILFNTADVRAIQYGRKTVMRRVVKDIPSDYLFCGLEENPVVVYENEPLLDDGHTLKGLYATFEATNDAYIEFPMRKAPYKPGDILNVREAFFEYKGRYYYKADEDHVALNDLIGGKEFFKWRPSIHMPKEAARIFLQVKSVRVEHLQDIDYEGCKAEGIWDDYKTYSQEYHDNLARRAYPVVFSEIWNDRQRLCDLERYGWDANPWAWVIEFERISKEEAEHVFS